MATKNRVSVDVRNGDINAAINHFEKMVRKSGILQKYRENQEYIKPSAKRREASKKAKREEKMRDKR